MRLGSQRDPLVGGASQPRITRHKVIHVLDVHHLSGVVGLAQAHKNVVPGFADGDLILEIEMMVTNKPATRR